MQKGQFFCMDAVYLWLLSSYNYIKPYMRSLDTGPVSGAQTMADHYVTLALYLFICLLLICLIKIDARAFRGEAHCCCASILVHLRTSDHLNQSGHQGVCV